MNAQVPDNDDKKVAKKIRNTIMKKCIGKPQKIPARWYIFFHKLLWMAQKLGRNVFKKSECIRIGYTAGCSPDSCVAALKFFSDLNHLLQY